MSSMCPYSCRIYLGVIVVLAVTQLRAVRAALSSPINLRYEKMWKHVGGVALDSGCRWLLDILARFLCSGICEEILLFGIGYILPSRHHNRLDIYAKHELHTAAGRRSYNKSGNRRYYFCFLISRLRGERL